MKKNIERPARHSSNTIVSGIPQRIIKFRAWDKDAKVLYLPQEIYGDMKDELGISLSGDTLFFYESSNGNYCPSSLATRRANVILMQFTGFKDVNGKEIYEGDILSLWYSRDTTGKDIVKFNHKVEWEDTNGFSGWNIPFLESAEIIGNVFENPDLAE